MSSPYAATIPSRRFQPPANPTTADPASANPDSANPPATDAAQPAPSAASNDWLNKATQASEETRHSDLAPASKARQVRIILNQLATFTPILGAMIRTDSSNDPAVLGRLLDTHKRIAEQVIVELDLSPDPITRAQVGRGIAGLIGQQWNAQGIDINRTVRDIVDAVNALQAVDGPRPETFDSPDIDALFGHFHTVSRLSSALGPVNALDESIRIYLIPPDGDTTRLIAGLSDTIYSLAATVNSSIMQKIEYEGQTVEPADKDNADRAWRGHITRLFTDTLTSEPDRLMKRLAVMSDDQLQREEQQNPDGLLKGAVTRHASMQLTQLLDMMQAASTQKPEPTPGPHHG